MQLLTLFSLCIAGASALVCDPTARSADQSYTFSDVEETNWAAYKKQFGLNFPADKDDFYQNILLCNDKLEKLLDSADDDVEDDDFHLNQYSFLDPKEFKAMLQGFKDAETSTGRQDAPVDGPVTPTWTTTVPDPGCSLDANNPFPGSIFDWYSKGKVSAIKNQKECGSCFAQAAIAVVESMQAIVTGQPPVNMSVQAMVDCPVGNGCNGGDSVPVYQYIQGKAAVDLENNYPYTGVKGQCHESKNRMPVYITGTSKIPPNRADLMEQAIRNFGPITASLKVAPDFQLLGKMVYSTKDPVCAKPQNDHEIVLIGFGNINGTDFWIGRNSWGCSWGISGFFLIQKGVNMCGIEADADYPILSKQPVVGKK